MNNDFTISLGNQSRISYHGRHTEQDFSVTLADTGLECMTGGRVKKIQKHVDGDTFLLTYGDGLIDVDISKLLAFHCSHGKLATVTSVAPVSRFGILETSANQVLRFAEKPKTDSWISAGYFVLNRKVFDYLGGDECVFEREPIERLAFEGQLMTYPHEGFFYAMDTYREYQHLNEIWGRSAAPWKVWA
jgi:glucose-1-phosphate cytidylyltransferase